MIKVHFFGFLMLSFIHALYATLLLTAQEQKPFETGLLFFTQLIRFFPGMLRRLDSSLTLSNIC